MREQEESADTQDVDFGGDDAHNYHHVMIDNLNDEVILDEVEESKQVQMTSDDQVC
jgi:hypothetical protein